MVGLYLKLREVEVWLAAAALAGVVGLVFWATVTRVLGAPNVWVIELTQILFAWTCLLSASVAYRRATLFSVDILSPWLPKRLLGAMTILKSLIVLTMVVWLGVVAMDFFALANRRPLPLTGIRFSWVAATIPAACAMMALTCLETIVRTLRGADAPERSL